MNHTPLRAGPAVPREFPVFFLVRIWNEEKLGRRGAGYIIADGLLALPISTLCLGASSTYKPPQVIPIRMAKEDW